MPKIIDHETRRREVAGVILDVIAREGLAGVTVRKIAESSGWSTGVLAHYFEDKDSMVSFALDHLVELMVQRLESCRGKTGREGLVCLLAVGLPLDRARRFESRVWFSFLGPALANEPLAKRMRNLHRSYRELVTARVRECQKASKIDPRAGPAELASMLLAAVDGISAHAAFGWGVWSPDSQRRALERVVDSLSR